MLLIKTETWLYELNDYIQENYKYLVKFFKENFKDIIVAPLESTYLAWVDCSSLKLTSDEIKTKQLNEAGLLINSGSMYRSPDESFIRINLGCTKATLAEALNRFKACFKS